MSSKAKILIKGSSLRVFSFFANVLVAFFMMPFLIRSLGDKMYGLWIFVGSFLGFYWLFDIGLGSAIQRYVSKAIGSKDYDEANKVINTSLFIFILIGLVALFVSFISALVITFFIKNITEVALLKQIIIILGLSFAISLPMRVFSGILVSHMRYDLITAVSMLRLLINTILIVIFLKMGYGILALALITFTSDLIQYAIIFILTKKIAEYLVFSQTLIDRTKIKALFNYSGFTFIAQIGDKLRFNLDNFVITAFLGLSFVTLFSIAARLVQYFMDFIVSALGMMVPVFSQYEGQGDYQSIREKFILTTKISSYLSILLGGTLILFGKQFIERWMGKEYLGAYPLLLVLVVPITLALMQNPSLQLLYGISKHKFLAIANLLEGIVNLILSIILVRRFGLIGVALGTAIPMMVIKLFIQPVYVCRLIKLDLRKYYFEIIVPILLKSLTIFVIFWWLSQSFNIPNYLNLSILISCEGILFLAIIFFIELSAIERRYFMKLIFNTK